MSRNVPDGSSTEQLSDYCSAGPMYDISLVFPAAEESVRRASQSVRQALAAMQISEMTLGTVEIVLVEAANNIVEHAYANMQRGAIRLGCSYGGGLVRFELLDNGTTLPKGRIPPKRPAELDCGLSDLPEGGFGWGLIHDMTTSLSYERCGSRNVLRFSIAVES